MVKISWFSTIGKWEEDKWGGEGREVKEKEFQKRWNRLFQNECNAILLWRPSKQVVKNRMPQNFSDKSKSLKSSTRLFFFLLLCGVSVVVVVVSLCFVNCFSHYGKQDGGFSKN